MEEFEHNNKIDERSTASMLAEIGRLVLKLLIVVLKAGLKFIIRTIVLIIKACMAAWKRWLVFWNDNDTQAKVRYFRIQTLRFMRAAGAWLQMASKQGWKGFVRAMKLLLKWTILGIFATGRGIVWTARNTVQAIIHMKPTVVRMWKAVVAGLKAFWAWLGRCRRGIRLSNIRRRRRYEAFKREGGFKGALSRTSTSLKESIASYMEEDQDEVTEGAVTEDDLLEETLKSSDSRAGRIGKRIFDSMKDMAEE